MKELPKSFIALGVALVALVLFTPAVTPIAHTGESAYILAQKLGIDPFPSFTSPVYGWVVRVLGAVFGGATIWAVNMFSAVCAAGVLALLFSLVYRATRSFNVNVSFPQATMHRIQVAAGLISVLYLLAVTPFWMAATRANPLTFDLLLLLLSFYLVVSFTGQTGLTRIMLACLLYGVTIVEFTTAILVAPFFGILALSKLWETGLFSFRAIGQMIGCVLIGLLLYLVQAGLYITTEAYVWREFRDFFQVVWYIWLDQYQGLTGGLPRVGWLTLALVSVLPWIITAGFRVPGGPTRVRGALLGAGMLNVVLGVLAIFTLHDFPLAPASITGTFRLFVTPYLLIALWVGHVAAFWLVVLFRQKRFEAAWLLKFRRAIGVVLLIGFPLYLVAVMAVQAIPQSRSASDRLVHEFARYVVDSAKDKEWLITNTAADDQISLEIRRRGLPINVIRLGYARSPALMKYVSSLFDENPRLQSLARIGMEPLIDQWFLVVPDVEKKVSVVTIPDLWLAAGYEALPRRVVFNGARTEDDLPLDDLLAEARGFWADFGTRIIEAPEEETPAGAQVEWIRIHLSKVANNLGILLEDQGRTQDAYECYQQARRFAPDNLSALMNLHVLAQREGLPDFESLEAELIQRTENMMGRVQALSLSLIYGFVRVPELFANRGMTFAMSGKASLAITEMKRALALHEGSPQLKLALAGLYFAESRDAESRESYQNILRDQPDSANAVAGLMRLDARQGDFDGARRQLQRLRELGVGPAAISFEEAMIESLAGNAPRGLILLQEVVKAQPENLRAWAALAGLASELNDAPTAEQALKKLREAKALTPGIQLLMAQAAMNQQDRDGARRHLNDVLRRQPNNTQALEMLLRLYMSESARDKVFQTAERIITFEPRNALANYMLGVHHYFNEEYALAESAYRVSLAARRTPEALNDLAYVLHLQNRSAEAETFVRESLQLSERNSAAWDTLGVVLMAQNKLPEAEEALRQSLSLRPETASVLLSLAQLHEKQGRFEEAEQIAREINARLNELSPQAQGALRELLRRLDARR
ncbi:MAG TPA: tetratricopeptide repeat protein [Kiritimatiellia bacterium]|nr:tetratricopeptide repeat protein [Kiritimatiellia bacterium]HMO99880.1 tetratricopeptide repeat protein [Kiritimatiellia bacterium]HMP96751.1 tetratricopeptide repeat protein [Kiritimatiellia bacterium]